MNLKEIEYIVKIAEERNVTRAAEKLFITPSALNQQLLHLERDIASVQPLPHRLDPYRSRGSLSGNRKGDAAHEA